MTCSFESCAENSRRGTSVSRRRSSAHSHMRVNACSVNCAGGDFGIRTRWSILPQPSSNSSRISKSGGARDVWRSTCRGTIVRAAFRSSLKGSKAWSGHTDRGVARHRVHRDSRGHQEDSHPSRRAQHRLHRPPPRPMGRSPIEVAKQAGPPSAGRCAGFVRRIDGCVKSGTSSARTSARAAPGGRTEETSLRGRSPGS